MTRTRSASDADRICVYASDGTGYKRRSSRVSESRYCMRHRFPRRPSGISPDISTRCVADSQRRTGRCASDPRCAIGCTVSFDAPCFRRAAILNRIPPQPVRRVPSGMITTSRLIAPMMATRALIWVVSRVNVSHETARHAARRYRLTPRSGTRAVCLYASRCSCSRESRTAGA